MHVMSRVVVSGVRAGWDGNRGYVTAEASVTGRCWGRGCCQHTTWGHRGLILIINQISPISPQTHCCSFPFPPVLSSLTQPGSGQPTPSLCGSRGSQPHSGGLPWGQEMGSRQVPPVPHARQHPCWETARLGFLQAFPEQIPPKNKPVSKFLGKGLQLLAEGTGGSQAGPEQRWPGSEGCSAPWLEAARPLLPQEPWLGRAGCGSAPSLQESLCFHWFFFHQLHPRAGHITRGQEQNGRWGLHSRGCPPSACHLPPPPPRADTAVPTLAPQRRVSTVPTAPRHARLPAHP